MPTCFVIQPFDAGKFDDRYEQVFAPAITSGGLTPYRVDQDARVEVPIEAIEAGIRDAVICLADITTDNPNVWYELGYAMALGKPVVMVCSIERGGKYPFDIQHRAVISYRHEAPADFEKLEDAVTAKIKALIDKGHALKQIANADPVAPVSGLSQSELTVLATIAGSVSSPDSWVSLYSARQEVEREFLTPLGFTLAVRRLTQKKLIQSGVDNDYNDNEFDAVRVTDLGWVWIDENESSFVIRRATDDDRRKESLLDVGLTDDDIPF
jgi:hypothetical protein